MKLIELFEQKEMNSIEISIGDTTTTAPSKAAISEIDRLVDYFRTKFLTKYKGSFVGMYGNSQKRNYKLSIAFDSDADRIKAVKHIRNELISDYIRTVKSINL